MLIVSSNRTRIRPLPRSSRSTSGPLEMAASPSGTIRVMANTALRSGSSQHGKARRASAASNCVVAIVWTSPSSSAYVDR